MTTATQADARRFRSSHAWQQLRLRVLALQRSCSLCGGTAGLEVHHVEPLVEAWHRRLDPLNVVVLCYECHAEESQAERVAWASRDGYGWR